MKRNFILVTICLIFGCQLSLSQLLWRVQYPGSENVSYVLGTHHLAPVSVIDSIHGLSSAINSVDSIYGEIDMLEMRSVQAMQLMHEAMIAPNDSTLDVLLTESQLDSLSVVVSPYNINVENFKFMKPSAVGTMLLMYMAPEIVPGGKVGESMDEYIQSRGRAMGKQVKGLESVEFQLELLYGKSMMEQARDLMHVVANFNQEKEISRQLTQSYMSQDFPGLARLVLSPTMSADEIKRLIYNRNISWANFLSPMLMHQKALIAVGVAHLVGPFGVLERLRRYGYDVTPVNPG